MLSGAKCFVPLADRASHFLVLARNGGDGADAVQAFIVPRDAAGLAIAAPEKNLGLRALPTGTLDARPRRGARRRRGSAATPAATRAAS